MDLPATVTSKGQITLPKRVREELGLKTGDQVLFRLHEGQAIIAKVPHFLELKGTVPLPPGKGSASWASIRTETWRRRATDRR